MLDRWPLHIDPSLGIVTLVGYKYDAEDFIEAGVEAVLDQGLARLTFGHLAKRMGISDRTIVYYFPTKPDLVRAVATRLGDRLFLVLEQAFSEERLPRDEILKRAWPVLASRQADPIFELWFELIGLAAAGVDPYPSLASELIEAWVQWLAPRMKVEEGQDPRDEAASVVAVIDGLLLLRTASGQDLANGGAAALGVVGGDLVEPRKIRSPEPGNVDQESQLSD